MVKFQKDVFWKAAVFTVAIFLLGVILGYILEASRLSEIEKEYKQIEIEWADSKLQSSYYKEINPEFCDFAIKENIKFADKIYEQGIKIERYEQANKLTDAIILDKKRYALLKIEFWMNSIILKEKCRSDYKNVVYFYDSTPSITQKPLQETISKLLKEMKNKYADKIMLIPVPVDLDLSIIDIMKETYSITIAPTILIDEKLKIEDLPTKEELEQIIEN